MTPSAPPAQSALSAPCPVKRSTGVFGDIRHFLFARPPVRTLIHFRGPEDKNDYRRRILQRIEINLEPYHILNLHHIGINVPMKYVFEELVKWNGDSTCWPNHIAQVERRGGTLDDIDLYLFGRRKYPFGIKKFIPGLGIIPLFKLKAITIERSPVHYELDNARYLLYQCSGGYPIGYFSLFVRNPMDQYDEKEASQLFLLVSFNAFGKRSLSRPTNLVRWVWEAIHNRVTANILYRFKLLCEWKFQRFLAKEGEPSAVGKT